MIHITALSGIGVGRLRTMAPKPSRAMANGDPGAGVKDPSEFTSAAMNVFPTVGAGPKISGVVEDARMLPPLRNGLVVLSIRVIAPSWIEKVPAEEYRYVLVESIASAPRERFGSGLSSG